VAANASTSPVVDTVVESRADVAPRLRTLLLTDLCNSTELVEKFGDARSAELFQGHDRLVLELQQRWRARLIDRSDGLLLLFERAIDGLGFALDYVRGLRDLGKAHGVELQARAGLHVGEVLTWQNSREAVNLGAKPLEVEGLAKPMAARLMALARPGQILVSAVAEPLAHRASRELGPRGEQLLWKSWGRWRFKGVPGGQEIFEVGEAGLAPLRIPRHNAKAWRDIPLWRRPVALAAEVVVLAAVAVTVWFATRPQPAIAFSERDWVVVGDLRNVTGDARLDDALEQAFRISLEQSRYVNVLSDLKARDTLGRMQRPANTTLDRAIASEIALRDGARAVILPTVAEVGGKVRITAEVVDPHTQATVYTEMADGTGEGSALDSIDRVAASLRGRLGEAVASIQKDSQPLPEVTTKNLDALRAYALGVKATGDGDWSEAERFFSRAISLDDGFALAYMGLVRLHWSSADYAEAMPYLDKALALRSSLPPRDQLYLDAWKAETSAVGTPLESWKMLAKMYPDYFAGTSNTAWYLFVDGRYRDALSYAKQAAVPQDPLRTAPLELIGRIQLALNQPQDALASLAQSEQAGGGRPTRYRADALALLGRYDDAWKALDAVPREQVPTPASLYANLESISIALDQGQFQRAAENARLAGTASARIGPIEHQRFEVVGQMVAFLRDPASLTSEQAKRLIDAAETGFGDKSALRRRESGYGLLAAIYLAQRGGQADIARETMSRIAPGITALDNPDLNRMMLVLQATQQRLDGHSEEAIRILEKDLDGHELVQTHVALLQAYQAAGRDRDAIRQADWLIANRGRGYVEFNLEQALQPLNVADARLASLWASESCARIGDAKAAASRRAAFLAAWPESRLPDYLRRKL
jgi:putative peptide modification system cyclase